MAVELPAAAVEALARNPRVARIEPDGIATKSATQSGATWGLDRIDQASLPLNGSYTYPDSAGAGVHAYILDTGILTGHTEFGSRLKPGHSVIKDRRGTTDCDGHGTHVAGTVGGSTWGVAKQAWLVPVRVLDCRGSGTWSGIIAGLDWVRANHVKPAVANMSLGGGAISSVDAAVANLVSAGVTVVVAAGNSNLNACNYSPARAATAITVGATASNDARAGYSNFGTCLDIFAPGSGITSAWFRSTTSTNTISGTSMASPHVAGVAALLLGANTSWTPAQVASALTGRALTATVGNPGPGSPNLLLNLGTWS
jgi:subtilisin family serine protease